MKNNDAIEIDGKICITDDNKNIVRLYIDDDVYEAEIDSNEEFVINLPQESFAQELTKLDILIVSTILLSVFCYSFYEIVKLLMNFHFHYGLS
jgi:hypothetical protein